ncbi:transmembrane protein [Achlya hypogyna]|uniref:Transmembrane protein n=1 Tax=Achlya hypogyna TaxID=1202772 RepID=A0A1V9ZUE6_ACHHY|nr:transmembrane protein [Achlya hypogyna]
MSSTELATTPPKRRLLERIYYLGRVQPAAVTLSWLGLLLGAVWLLLHPVATVTTGELKTRGTYFSENALLVDSVTSSIGDKQAAWAKQYHREYIALDATGDEGCANHTTCSDVTTWIEKQLRAIPGVEVYRQTYSEQLYEHDEYVRRTNVYAILRAAPLADGKESVVLVAQYPNIPATAKNGYSALSVGMALLRHLGGVKWLAKDVVLLLTDDGPDDGRYGHSPGVEAWLEDYHNDPFAPHNAALEMHAGVIRAAINLETSGDDHRYNAVGIFGAGVNGQLPNLDMINTVVEALENERISIVLDRCADVSFDCADDVLATLVDRARRFVARHVLPGATTHWYFDRLAHLLRFMQTLATGPSGPHANFIRYNVDAFTLSALHAPATPSAPVPLTGLLRAIETSVRAVSSLEEKLHQSFFFYLLVGPRDFVSIGEYYYPLVLAMLPLFAQSLFLATNTAGLRAALAIAALAVAQAVGGLVLLATTHVTVFDVVVEWAQDHQQTVSRTYCWTIVVLATSLELLAVFVLLPRLHQHPLTAGNAGESDWLAKIADHRRAFRATQPTDADDPRPPEVAPPDGPMHDRAVVAEPFSRDEHGWKATKLLAMVFAMYVSGSDRAAHTGRSIVHCVLGILNFSLAIAVVVPTTVLLASVYPAAAPAQTTVGRVLRATLLLVTSPALLLLVMQAVNPTGTWPLIAAAMDLGVVIDDLAFLVHGYVHFGSFAVPYACTVYLPLHLLALWVWTAPDVKAKLD